MFVGKSFTLNSMHRASVSPHCLNTVNLHHSRSLGSANSHRKRFARFHQDMQSASNPDIKGMMEGADVDQLGRETPPSIPHSAVSPLGRNRGAKSFAHAFELMEWQKTRRRKREASVSV